VVLVLCHADVEARNCLSNRGEGQQQGTPAATAAVAATPQLCGQAVQRDVSPRVMSSRPADNNEVEDENIIIMMMMMIMIVMMMPKSATETKNYPSSPGALSHLS